MLTEQTSMPIFTDIDPTRRTVSIAIDHLVYKDGELIATTRNRKAFAPGEIEAVKEFIGVEESPEITYLSTIWTEEVIGAYLDSLHSPWE